MISEKSIRDLVYYSNTYVNGCQYYKRGKVKDLKYIESENAFGAVVKGGTNYDVAVRLNDDGQVNGYRCSCPAFAEYQGACKHIIALVKVLQTKSLDSIRAQSVKKITLNPRGKSLLDFFNKASLGEVGRQNNSEKVMVKLVPSLCIETHGRAIQKWIEFTIGDGRLYVMKNVKDFVEAVVDDSVLHYGKSFTFKPNESYFDAKAQQMVDLLQATYLDEKNMEMDNYYAVYYNSMFSENKRFRLSNINLRRFLEIMKDETFTIWLDGIPIPEVRVLEGRPNFNFTATAFADGFKLALDLEDGAYHELDSDYKYFYHQKVIYKVDEVFRYYAAPLMKYFKEIRKHEMLIPQSEIHNFVTCVVPEIEKIAKVHMDSSLTKSFYREELEKQVFFDKFGDGISAKINFKYGDILINPADGSSNKSTTKNGMDLLRELSAENKLINIFLNYEFEIAKGIYIQKHEDKAFEFLRDGLEQIKALSEAYYSDEFKKIGIKNNTKVTVGVRVNTGTGLLEMNINYDDIEPKELMDLLASYKLKKKYYRLKKGSFISLDSSEIQSASELIEQLNLTQTDISKKVIELPKYRAMYIDSLARENEGIHIERSSYFKKIVQDVCEPQDMEFELPEGINGQLRDYQKIGYKWLKTLAYYGFGGILADDMGLGKTLQIITLVKSEAGEKRQPSIVIAPTSLLYNWQEEVNKFAPDMTVTVLSGNQNERRERFSEIEQSDIIVTSYGMIKRDIELYQDFRFKYCFIDEAQHIKNPTTLNAKAVKQIKAGGYFALTGTPIENTLTELWSIFDFIMPGYLLSHNKFLSKFESPIVKNGDTKALKELGRHIKPFVLRRMKKEVLKELPEKIESKMTNEMTEAQSKIYTAYFMRAKKEFQEEISANGFENSRIKIIAILTRLRQICCHPALFIDNYDGGSGKLEMLMELLEDAIDGGHRILVFSQFTSMLAIIKSDLDNMKRKYNYLDGSTSAEERIRLVNAFNGGEKDIFLISLKAGGTGLNLTGADMVIHFDPWWNPAVEDQATDRAYRIGQENIVQVFKLITKGTIEEKIFELQQKKKELIESVIKPGESFLTKMSEQEIRKLFEL